jgi:hypothetical protein
VKEIEGIQVMTFKRSDVEKICCITSDGRKLNKLQDLREHPTMMQRKDIVLINFWRNNEPVGRQLFVEPYADGIPRGDAWEFLTADEQKWCIEENARLITLAEDEPEFARLLRG